MKTYRYETHLHTAPVSRCGHSSPEESVEFYKAKGYDGVFITNHFIDGNINIEKTAPFDEKIHFYFSDYERAKIHGDKLGLKVFPGVELSNFGTDFLIYGLYEDWYLAHPEIQDMIKSEELALMRNDGALVIQAHPFRQDPWIDHIRLYPWSIDGVEVINGGRTEFQNKMAAMFAESYGLLRFAGSDNHRAGNIPRLAGVETTVPINSVEEFISVIRSREYSLFFEENTAD